MSADPDQEYFSDGISEELLNLLSKIPELRVISRSSAFSFKGNDIDIPTIAAQLNVAHILEGSVRKAGNQVRITAQLIEARSDTHLRSETYDRELENIFAIQDEISAAIIGALKEPLGLQLEAVPRVIAAANTEAHDAYLH
jgi:TolB-like protein